MQRVRFSEEKIYIDTYPEAEREELPMFAENRVHQRTSGNPYPNKVVLEAQRKLREKREYTLLKLENEFLEIGILPALGGKIWYARDKKKGYDFFYKNNVIKPALIGVLGSWTSGGLEFNWPFHHRASTFMPVDYAVEETDEGITVWLSEHDPIDRMKGMVGVCLKNGECIFETKAKLDNITPLRRPFLWWENTAVPVHENYSIFFPEDVNYVRFHYKRSVTTYPIANNERFGAFNGIYYDGDTDISKHKNTRQATSYFSAESEYDYFGGYDYTKQAGVVHIADHHISPGKKMFTWAYSQLAKTWETALTDTDGQYAELMAGCYSDNQPDFAWLQPYETKSFSQYWFPVHEAGTPAFANENGAFFFTEAGLLVQCVKPFKNARIRIEKGGALLLDKILDLPAYELINLFGGLKKEVGLTVSVTQNGERVLFYAVKEPKNREIPEPRKELPYFKEVETAEELYLEGLHVEQYRSPEYSAEVCYLEALKRDEKFTPALTALAEIYLSRLDFEKALQYANRAEACATRFNIRTESGKIYYLKALALAGKSAFFEAYDYLRKSAWNADYYAAAMLHAGLLSIRSGNYKTAEEHFTASLERSTRSVVARPFLAYVKHLRGKKAEAEEIIEAALKEDKVNLYAHAVKAFIREDFSPFNELLSTDATGVALDISAYLLEAGLKEETAKLIEGIGAYKPLSAMAHYVRNFALGKAERVEEDEGIAFANRSVELAALDFAIAADEKDSKALYLRGCLLYGKGQYRLGAENFERLLLLEPKNYKALRNLAVAYYSHLGDVKRAKKLMKEAAENAPKTEKQITFERAYLMAKTGDSPEEIANFILSRDYDRDDLYVELARAYNHAGREEDALKLMLSRTFVACEGGEHYITDQYMYALWLRGIKRMKVGDYFGAIEAFEEAQVLPASLGSGLWNDVKRIPFRYFKALCLEKLGKREEAAGIYKSFTGYYLDYFSNMYLNTLPYYMAKAYTYLGEKEKGDALIKERLSLLEAEMGKEDMGNYSTTPFFLSFIDQPAVARKNALAYPAYLYSRYLKDKEREALYYGILQGETYGVYIDDRDLLSD